MLTSRIHRQFVLVILLLHAGLISAQNNEISSQENYKLHKDPYKTAETGRRIFDFRKNGVRVNLRVIPGSRNVSSRFKVDDGFPEFPVKDIGRCFIDLSLVCAKKRFGRFLESIRQLNEIFLMGEEVKLVKTRVKVDRNSNEANESIQRSIDDFFDTFALRVTLPRWNGRREMNQIDVMLDETSLVEGRRKGGGGGGGGLGGGGKGGGGGGKCKMMMMAGLMMIKLKIMGVAAMKSMMMAGMSLMLSMVMFMQKFMKGGSGPWPSFGGGGGGGGGGHLKEIVLLTKAPYGGGGGGGSNCCPSDSYGAPPSSSYGAPSGGGGGYGGGGGWGRSFGKRLIMTGYDKVNRTEQVPSTNLLPMIEESKSDTDHFDYPNGKSTVERNLSSFNWNSSDYNNLRYHYINMSDNDSGNNTNVEPLLHSNSDNYGIEANPVNLDTVSSYVDSRHLTAANSMNYDVNKQDGNSYIVNTNRPDISYDTNVVRPIYTDEWQAIEEKITPFVVLPSNLNERRDNLHDSGHTEFVSDSVQGI